MSDSARTVCRIARAIAFSALLAMPACAIPKPRQPVPAPPLPPAFTGGTRPVLVPQPTAYEAAPTAYLQPAVPEADGPARLPAPELNAPAGPEALPPPTSGGAATAPEPLPSPFPHEALSTESSAQLGVAQFFNDPVLVQLVDQAMAGNRELMVLNEEVQIASNEVLARRGAYLPFVNFAARADLTKNSRFTPIGAMEEQIEYLPGKHFPDPVPDFLGAFNLFWRLDIWREFRNARDAAQQRYVAANERRNFFVTQMIADIADDYYELMALDKRLENLDQTIQLQQQSLDIARAKKEAGRGTELAVQRFEAEVRKNQSEKLVVYQEIIEAENRINFLANRFPQPVERYSADFFNLNLGPLNAGVPAQLLANRPDIRQAERELAAAGLDVKSARARFFPTIDISAGVGYEAFDPHYLFWTPESLIYNVAGDLVAPVINKKAIQAEYMSASARQLQALYDYQRVVLNAFTQVVNRFSAAQNYSRSIDLKRQQLQDLEASVESARRLFLNPRVEEQVDYLEVLLAQRDLRDARMTLIDAKQQQLSAVVNAYQALGGGDPRIASGFCPLPPP